MVDNVPPVPPKVLLKLVPDPRRGRFLHFWSRNDHQMAMIVPISREFANEREGYEAVKLALQRHTGRQERMFTGLWRCLFLFALATASAADMAWTPQHYSHEAGLPTELPALLGGLYRCPFP